MQSNLTAFIASLLFVFLLIFLALFLAKKKLASGETIRKIVHIGVSNWYFIYIYCFSDDFWAIVGLLVFALIDFLALKFGILSQVFGQKDNNRNWGLVYYPLSIVVMLLSVRAGFGDIRALGCGLLCMGYGDGLAALIGKAKGKTRISLMTGGKTWLGTFTMTLVSTLVIFLIYYKSYCTESLLPLFALSFLLGLFSAVAEAVTPLGLDNVSVPLGVFAMAGLLC